MLGFSKDTVKFVKDKFYNGPEDPDGIGKYTVGMWLWWRFWAAMSILTIVLLAGIIYTLNLNGDPMFTIIGFIIGFNVFLILDKFILKESSN